MKCPAFLKPHLIYLRWGLPWVFIIPTLKIAGFLLWPWWLVCFSTFAGPVVYCYLVIRSDLKDCEADLRIELIEIEEEREIFENIHQELLRVAIITLPDNTE